MHAGCKPRILYLLAAFPQLSQTYILTELRMLWGDYDIRIVASKDGNQGMAAPHPYDVVPKRDLVRLRAVIEEFSPDVLHAHWLLRLPYLHKVAVMTGRPYTIRAHSFDVFQMLREPRRRRGLTALNSDYCLGVLTFPYTRPLLEAAGVRGDKIVDCWPVVDFARFHDTSANGDGVMNVGASIPKKNIEGYLELAASLPETRFDYYPIGYATEEYREQNRRLGYPVNFLANQPYELMPAAYKAHRWLVYTALADPTDTAGWPMAVAEAQAAGVGVCLQSARADQKTYVGEGGVVFSHMDEIRELIRGPVPDDMRQAGFEQAKKSDFASHRHLLEELWQPAFGGAYARPRKRLFPRSLMKMAGA